MFKDYIKFYNELYEFLKDIKSFSVKCDLCLFKKATPHIIKDYEIKPVTHK